MLDGNSRQNWNGIFVCHGVSRDLAVLLLKDMKAALAYLAKHPLQKSLTSEEASGFHH